jgi:Concanavalin A-like lectin/glucanases superfamily
MNTGSVFNSLKFKSLRDSFEPMLKSMRGGANAMLPGGVPGAPPANIPIGRQLIETFVITLVFSVSMQILESSFSQLKRYQAMAVDMYPLTYDSPQTFIQSPDSGFPILEPSKDERNGTEFSYSCFLSVQPETFTGEKNAFKHVFHKGSANVFPLMSPGVFFKADTNTLRVYMNTTMNWNNYVDIPNIPLKKWFHLVVMTKGRSLDVYINGNLANRLTFADIPKLNYGSFYLFLPKNVNTQTLQADICTSSTMASDVNVKANITTETEKDLTGVPITITGRMSGFASRIKYHAFALTYAQIDKLVKEGPNPTMFRPSAASISVAPHLAIGWDLTFNSGPVYVPNSNQFDKNMPGYQTDSWWTSDNHSGTGPE